LSNDLLNLRLRRTDTSEMRHGGQLVALLDGFDDGERFVARAPAGAVGDGAIIRLERGELRQRLVEEISLAVLGLGREKLERDDGPARRALGGVEVADQDVGLHRRRKWRQPAAFSSGQSKAIAVLRRAH
jgi:hypothetical protein